MEPKPPEHYAKGFTFIELMIVIAIIGIIVAVGVPSFIAFRNKPFCTQAEHDAASIAAAVGDYYSDPNHTGLVTVGDLAGLGTISGTISGSVSAIVITVTDPGGCPRDNTYQITIPGDPSTDGWS